MSTQPTAQLFSGGLSYLKLPQTNDYTQADLAIIGVPVDSFVSGRSGARLGPRAIRVASTMIAWDVPFGWGRKPFGELQFIDAGDCPFDYARPHKMGEAIRTHFSSILKQNTATLALGGDHYITYPILQAYAEDLGKPLSLIQFDSHPDTWSDDLEHLRTLYGFDAYEDKRMDHGTMFYQAVKEGIIEAEKSVQLGVRTNVEDSLGMNVISAPQIHAKGIDWAIKKTRSIVGDNPVYLTFDIDFLDPAYAPGTGTPCCAGFSTATALEAIRKLAGIRLIAMDLVEVSPPYDSGEITALAGATIASHLLCLFAHKNH